MRRNHFDGEEYQDGEEDFKIVGRAHFACAQMVVWVLCVVVETTGSGTPHIPTLPFGPSIQLDFCPSLALPAVCLLGCHRPPTRLGFLYLWAVVTATGRVPFTMVVFTRELWWCL